MFAVRCALLFSFAIFLALLVGCQFVPKTQLDAAESQSRMLLEQKNALMAENENLKTHSHRLEDHVKQAEEELAALDEQVTVGHRQVAGAAHDRNEMPVSLTKRFVQLSQQHDGLEFDPQTATSTFDTDVLFENGKLDIRSDARPLLDEFANLLKSPEARELRVMVVGHTDEGPSAKSTSNARFTDSRRQASARALAVAEYLQSRGVREEQLAVTAFGKHQPDVASPAADERQRDHRVEIFVTGPHTPIVGWTESATDRY
jgi:outer membrane protein OmpA-like peptidoglycan-associated protein